MSTNASSPALKEIFNSARLEHIADEMRAVYPAFDAPAFLHMANDGLAELSVMQRMARVSECLHAVLPLGYEASLEVLRALAPRLNSMFVSMFLPHYVASYGRHRFDVSLDALKYFTRFGSSEFAVRHFLRDDLERTLKVMHDWSLDANEHVRRLASEGSRPRLPWSFHLEPIQANLTSPRRSSTRSRPTIAFMCANPWPTTSTTSPSNIPTGCWTRSKVGPCRTATRRGSPGMRCAA